MRDFAYMYSKLESIKRLHGRSADLQGFTVPRSGPGPWLHPWDPLQAVESEREGIYGKKQSRS